MSVWILDEAILDHSSLQNISSLVRFDGCQAWTARFKSPHRFSIYIYIDIQVWGLGWPFQSIVLGPLHKHHSRFWTVFWVVVLLKSSPSVISTLWLIPLHYSKVSTDIECNPCDPQLEQDSQYRHWPHSPTAWWNLHQMLLWVASVCLGTLSSCITPLVMIK